MTYRTGTEVRDLDGRLLGWLDLPRPKETDDQPLTIMDDRSARATERWLATGEDADDPEEIGFEQIRKEIWVKWGRMPWNERPVELRAWTWCIQSDHQAMALLQMPCFAPVTVLTPKPPPPPPKPPP